MSSSRRTSGDINILAMLDGQASGRRPRVLPASLRYGAAGVLACSLLATLVWFVQDDAAQASLHSGVAGPAAPPAGAAALRDTQPAGTRGVELVVTQRDDLLAASDSIPDRVPGTRTAPARAAPSPGLPVTAATRGAVIIDMPQPAPAGAPTIAAMPAHAAAGIAATRTTTHAAPPASTPSLARTGATRSHQKRGAAASGITPPSAVDRDVAVISAILQHTAARNETADTAPAPACPDKSCATRMPSRQ